MSVTKLSLFYKKIFNEISSGLSRVKHPKCKYLSGPTMTILRREIDQPDERIKVTDEQRYNTQNSTIGIGDLVPT